MSEYLTPIQIVQSPVINDNEPKKSSSPFIYMALFVLLTITGIFYFMFKPVTKSSLNEIAVKPTVTPIFLSFSSPKDQVTAVNGEILVSGTTLPNTTVVVYSEIDDVSFESDSGGKFETTVKIAETGGLLNVTVFSAEGMEETETFNVGESKEIGYLNPDVLAKSDTNQGQLKKVEKTASTKIVEFLQNKSEKVKNTKVGTEVVKKLSTIVPTGTPTSGNNLKVKKMTVTKAQVTSKMKRHAVSGIISSIAGDVITITHQIKRERTYSIFTNISTIVSIKSVENGVVSDLKVGMRIAAVGELVDQGILAKRIHVIPGKAIGVFDKNPITTGVLSITVTPTGSITISPTVVLSPTLAATQTITPSITPAPTITLLPSTPPEQ